jgi:hypothetical protein
MSQNTPLPERILRIGFPRKIFEKAIAPEADCFILSLAFPKIRAGGIQNSSNLSKTNCIRIHAVHNSSFLNPKENIQIYTLAFVVRVSSFVIDRGAHQGKSNIRRKIGRPEFLNFRSIISTKRSTPHSRNSKVELQRILAPLYVTVRFEPLRIAACKCAGIEVLETAEAE